MFVPSLEENLLIVYMAQKGGIQVDFEDEIAFLSPKGEMIPEHLRVEAKTDGGLYRLNVLPGGEASNNASIRLYGVLTS